MAMTDDSDFPRLTPPDDRFPKRDGLLRKQGDLTDDQFDLLAAAWAEGALAADPLSDMEAAIEALPSRRMRAESFRSIRLTPYNDTWIYRDRLLRQSPATAAIRRSLVITLLTAAAVIALIMLWPSTARQATDTLPGLIKESTAMSEALIPEASPIIIQGAGEEPAAGEIADINTIMPRSARNSDAHATVRNSDAIVSSRTADATSYGQDTEATEPASPAAATGTTEATRAVASIETTETPRSIPVSVSHAARTSLMIAAADNANLRPVEIKTVSAPQTDSPATREPNATGKEPNWVFRGVSALAKAITKEEKSIDGYIVASACVNGINNFLGWEMDLKRASNNAGDPVAVSFSSSLITVSAPVNKNLP